VNGRTRIVLLVSSSVLLALIALAALLGQSYESDGIYNKLDVFVEVMRHIRSDYVEPVASRDIFDGALRGMAATLDIESSYLTAEEYLRYREELPRRSATTGIEIRKHPGSGYAEVLFIRPGSPAAGSGVRAGDFIRAVDGTSTRDLPILMIGLVMAGEPESVASLSIIRTGVRGTLTFEVARAELAPAQVTHEALDGVGYISLPSFRLGVLESVQSACGEFRGTGIEVLIIDLRGNVDGDIEEAVHVADLFVADGELLTLRTKGRDTDYTAGEFAMPFNIFLLCDESTARAAEGFAVALADRGIATIIGRTTAGLATVQRRIELEDGALLNISHAKIIGPGGTDYHGTGVEPSVEVPTSTSEDGEDLILRTALERARHHATRQRDSAAVGG